ncbi:MAG TPA: hypothetical protein VHX42_02485 [Candidatus Babeliales bacterium]|jgi:antitoxin component of MazEF toxin-antitoxin module|nr:hypothetical protein [Candidatus Babeliales bacterium]
MLKKLVKYGNSNALILDRAILELLNINEGALVKICTDGKSLIITPQESKDSKEVWMEGIERLEDLKNARVAQMKKQAEDLQKTDPEKYQQMQEMMPGTEKGEKLAQAIKEVMDKYKNDLALLTTEPFLQAVDLLAAKHHNDKTSPAFAKEYFALRLKYAPDLARFDKDMQELQEKQFKTDPAKYERMKQWGPDSENGKKLAQMIKMINEKYAVDLEVLQSEAFLQKVEILTAKYKGDTSSFEYMKDFLKLRLKYVPNLVNYDKEIQEATTALGMPDKF